ncbi:hypothetical protein [Methylobacterium oryzihabitans]|uniref:Uncharacterized protein n=1 Tax=Methylobacterium oryzihabitans TaxID=2499852 RepID=A0A3S2V909_9HYPH|nr:hypothetical protein [Methylobacterium oryzihabitans]RVU16875.1 hypothetical protein EOE48_15550 [Methylobacterium oryzihabitans]
MGVAKRTGRTGTIVAMGTCGLARYATMSTGETIWWGSEEEVPDRVALAASTLTAAGASRPLTGGDRRIA